MIILQEKETAQETFDFIVGRLREQGKPSVNSNGSCVYGTPGGVRCAIGHLMGENACDSNQNLYGIVSEGIFKEPKFMDLLREIQENHDSPAVSEFHDGAVEDRQWAAECANRMICTAIDFVLNPASAQEWLDHVTS